MFCFRPRWLAQVAAWTAGMLAASVVPAQEPAQKFTPQELRQGFREGRVIAKPRAGSAVSALAAGEQTANVRAVRAFSRLGGLRVLQSDNGESVPAIVARLRASGRYEFVEPDYLKRASALPSDPKIGTGEQWGLNNLGLSSGIVGADIHASQGWAIRNDASNVVVAVIDSGIRATHEDIAANLWQNPGEIPANGVDDDNDGYIDDVNGINATAFPGTALAGRPVDDNGHGSHVSGIIGATGNNNIGIAGVAWRVKIMALKFLGSDGTGATSDGIECIDYAIAHGAHIINASYGGIDTHTYSQAELEAVRRARAAGIIFVAAAGNSGANLDSLGEYPASLPVDNIVSVGASSRRDEVLPLSNYGSGMVEIFAPGIEILSLGHTTNNAYVLNSGTSMAAPHVSGALALLKAQYPAEHYRQLINRLLRGASPGAAPVSDFRLRTQTGRLDIGAALGVTESRPFNDDWGSAIELSGNNLNARAGNRFATSESGEAVHAGVNGANSLWWRWKAPVTGEVSIDTNGSTTSEGTPLDTGLSVFYIAPLAVVALAADNDNAPGRVTSAVKFMAVAGATYQIGVNSRNAASGLVTLSIGSVPANDAFASPQILSGQSVRVTGSNQNASREADEPLILGNSGGRSLWYKWTAPFSRRFQIAAVSTSFDPLLAVYTGNSLGQLSLVAANDNSSPSIHGIEITDSLVTLNAVAGKTYLISVDSKEAITGDFVLTLVDSDWQFTTGFEVTSPPSVAPDGTVYVGSSDFYLYALRRDGSLKWSFETGYLVDGNGASIGADGTVYFGSTDGTFRALSPAGTLLWQYAADGSILGSPAIASDGSIYFKDLVGWLYALNSTGTLKWRRLISGDTYGSPAVAPDDSVYVGAAANGLFAYTPLGVKKWNLPLDGDIYTSPAIDGQGIVYVGTLAGTVYAVNPAGTIRWQRTVGSGISSSPALNNGVLYLGSYDNALHALNTSDGSVRWSCDLGDEVRASSPAIAADGSILIGCYDSLLYHINADGTVRRTYATADWLRSSPAIGDGRAYVGSNDGKVYAFNLTQGSALTGWPMLQNNARRLGRAIAATNPVITQSPSFGLSAVLGASRTATVTATGTGLTYQWLFNGTDIPGATGSSLTVPNFQSANAGLYTVRVNSSDGGSTTSEPAIGISALPTGQKFAGDAIVAGDNIQHPNGNVYDQLLLTGPAATFSADPGQVTRISYVNLADDIVQVEFSGPGCVALVLDVPAGTPPQPPAKYNQPAVSYMKGHARIYILGTTSDSYFSIFTVGRANAVNQALFKENEDYNGIANLGLVAIQSVSGIPPAFGAIFAGNASFYDIAGFTGIYAPGIAFSLPVRICDINAVDNATPVLITGNLAEVSVQGGSLAQLNQAPLKIGGAQKFVMRAGTNSHGMLLPARMNEARVIRDGVDVTDQVVQNP